jgi:GSH-dependent disulfide-bond oxidoreductase
MIDLYFATSPNVWKVCIALHEMGLPHRLIPVDLSKGEQHESRFLGIAAGGKVPAIVDHTPGDGGEPFTVFESGAILQYLAEKCGRFLPSDLRGRSTVMQWLFWQMGGLGPIGGQAWHFLTFAPVIAPQIDHSYARNRYTHMWSALWHTLDRQLTQREFIADDYSIADMACFPWIAYFEPGQVSSAFKNVMRWRDAMAARPAVRAAYAAAAKVDTGYGINEKGVTMFPWDGVLRHLIVT